MRGYLIHTIYKDWNIYRWPQLPEGNWAMDNSKNQMHRSFAIYLGIHKHLQLYIYIPRHISESIHIYIYTYIYIDIYTHTHLYIYIDIYIERERERESDGRSGKKHFLILKEVCEVKAYAHSVDALAVDTASHPSLRPSFWVAHDLI